MYAACGSGAGIFEQLIVKTIKLIASADLDGVYHQPGEVVPCADDAAAALLLAGLAVETEASPVEVEAETEAVPKKGRR